MRRITSLSLSSTLRNAASSTSKSSEKDGSGSRNISTYEKAKAKLSVSLKKLKSKLLDSSDRSPPRSTQREEIREEFAKQRAAAQTSQTMAEDNGMSAPENAFVNLTPHDQSIIRYEHQSSFRSSTGHDGMEKSWVTPNNAIHSSGPITMNLLAGTPGERETALATAIFKHVMAYDKHYSALTSATDGEAISSDTMQQKFGNTLLSIDPSKSKMIMPELAISLLLGANPEGGATQKTWDWRNDNNLKLNDEQANQLAERMKQHGIEPQSDQFTAAEKAATFVLATHESFIIGNSEDNAVKVIAHLPVAD